MITVYNRLKYLRNILLALEHQTSKPFEVIVADDGSRENLRESISDILPLISYPLKHVYQADLGFRLARSRNNGARVATGDYLLFLDQDVLMGIDFLSVLQSRIQPRRFMKFHPVWLDQARSETISKMLKVDRTYYDFEKQIAPLITTEERETYRKFQRKDKFYKLLYKLKLRSIGPKLIGLAIGVSKADFISVNGFDEKYIGWGLEDDDICARFYASGMLSDTCVFDTPIVHMWHGLEQTKDMSLNRAYYEMRKKLILGKKDYFCEYGYNNMFGEEVPLFTEIT
jgi:GT2 family glycosyltransferase